MDYKIKLITGYRRDQEHSISAEEAHKAYYLFNNPDQRGTFDNGLAILGSDIKEIVPDYQATMGWNHTHILDNDDWNELHAKGISTTMQKYLSIGKEIAKNGELADLNVPMKKLVQEKYKGLAEPKTERGDGMKRIGEV